MGLKQSEIKAKFRIFLVEDHAVFRQGLTRIIEQEKDLEVCGDATDAAEALKKSRTRSRT
jgi:DNA-binding NarL/FixJ family response regulator